MPFEHRIPHPLTPSAVRTYAPVLAGVYGVSSSREWLFIGQADNIQSALLQHLREADTAAVDQRPTGFVFETCMGERRSARTDRLIAEYAPAGNGIARQRSQSALRKRQNAE